MGFLFLLGLLLISIWQHYALLSSILVILLGTFVYIYASKLLKHSAKLKHELRKNIYIDANTGLPNRQKLLKDKKRLDPDTDATLMIINIDSFQNTNNFYGHHFGDAFLKVIAQWLSHNLPPIEATLYKFEADIYAILIKAPFSEYNLKKYLK